MNQRKVIFSIILFLGVVFQAAAQDTLFVEAITATNGNIIRWHPLRDSTWVRLLGAGYKVERYQLSNEGQPISSSRTVLAERLLPQDTTWFKQHAQDEEGVMEAVGALIHDTTFQFESKELMSADAMRFNFVVSEVLGRPAVALAVGLLVVDSTITTGASYRYVVSGLGATADSPLGVGDVDVPGGGGRVTNLPDFRMKFEFPDGLSLSDMATVNQDRTVPQVIGIARAYGDSIVLRWGTTTARLWMDANRDGYTIEREEVGSGKPREQIALVKPLPKDSITLEMTNDSIAMIAVSTLYSTAPASGEGGLFDKAGEFENRWTFSLFAAERSSLAADILGLRFVDRNVERGKEYIYMVKTASQPDFFNSAFIRLVNDYEAPPAPVSFSAEAGDRVITLNWEKSQNEGNFTAYKLERSEDKGKTWKALTENLLVFVEDPQFPLPAFSFKDSVGINYKEFRYRLQGLTSFGEMSKYAEVKGQAVDLTPPPNPEITEAAYNDTLKTATIRWAGGALPDDFDSYLITLNDQPEGGKTDTIVTKLKAAQKEFVYKPNGGFSGDRAHYFRVLSRDKRGNTATSLERYMHVPDRIPPPPPDTLQGNIADDGSVRIIWSHSQATDVTGYWLYFANDPDEEFSLLNPQPLIENTYAYKVPDVSLNKAAYYMVAAEDKSNNRGKPSQILKLKRPDKVPPVKPDFFNPVPAAGHILVNWKKSPSDDVAKYHVYRRLYGSDEEYLKIGEINSIDSVAFADTSVIMEVLYDYRIQAEDESGNLSEETLNFTSKLPFEPERVKAENFDARLTGDNKSTTLAWSFNPPKNALPPGQAYQFFILKSMGAKNVEDLIAVPEDAMQFSDPEAPIPGVLYNYAVQVRFANGQNGAMSPLKSVMIDPTGSVAPPPKKEEPKKGKKGGGSTGSNDSVKPAKMDVLGKSIAIANGDKAPAEADGTDFGRVGTGNVVRHVFLIKNSGGADLELPNKPVSLDGQDLSAWAILQPETTKISGGGSVEFSIEFKPRTEGERGATVRIGGKPAFEFGVKGVGIAAPEMDVQGKNVSILDGDNTPTPDNDTDFGGVLTGKSVTREFTIKNLGVHPLRLNSAPTLSGDSAFVITDFSLREGNLVIPAGDLATFTLSFSPLETGVHNATLTLASNDEDETPYAFRIQGLGSGPEMSLTNDKDFPIEPRTSPSAANGMDFGEVAVGGEVLRTFKIKNSGDRALNLTGKPVKVSIQGEHAADFTILAQPDETVKPGGGVVTFTLRFSPGETGLRTASVHIENNDANEGNFVFDIRGAGQ